MTVWNWKAITRVAMWSGMALLILMLVGVVSDDLAKRNEIERLTTSSARQRPVTEYNVAAFQQASCERSLQTKFQAEIGKTVLMTRADPGFDQQIAATAAAEKALEKVEELCPKPIPPVFTADGTLVADPVIPPQYTTTGPTIPADG